VAQGGQSSCATDEGDEDDGRVANEKGRDRYNQATARRETSNIQSKQNGSNAKERDALIRKMDV
jgi:hypothetical protein